MNGYSYIVIYYENYYTTRMLNISLKYDEIS